MSPQKSLEAIFERDLDQLPLPDADRWVPTEKRDLFPVAAVAALAIFLMVGLVTVAGIRDQVSSRVLSSPPTLVRPTVIGGVGIGPLPNDYRNTEFGYNLTVPAWLRASNVLPTNAAAKGLLHSARFTGRSPDQESALLGSAGARSGQTPTWDLLIEVWQRDGLSAGEWATQHDRCAAACTVGSAVIHGTSALTAEWTDSSDARVHAFYFERGPNILVLRYAIGSEAERPQDVTPELLEQVVRSIGLV